MEKKEELILVLTEHKAFGWKFTVHIARLADNGWREILGAPTSHKNQPEIVRLVDEMSDHALMKDYSKQKNIREFIYTVQQETKEKFIRPRIEMLNRKIIQAAIISQTPIYLRTDLKCKSLAENQRIRIFPNTAKCLFNFIKDEQGFRYFISLTSEGQHISLYTSTGIILSEKPCAVLIDRTVYNVEDIEAKKLTPFFAKYAIPVSQQMEETYLKTFAFKTMQQYEVNIQGFPQQEIKPRKKAFLSLERDFNKNLTLILSFQYEGNKRIYPGNPDTKTIGLNNINDEISIWWYNRDRDWEAMMIDILLANGLSRNGDNHFRPSTGQEYDLIEWINANSHVITDFNLEINLEENYYVGTVSLNQNVNMKIDWFELDITVTIGAFTLPLTTFKKHILTGNNIYTLPDKSTFVLPSEWFEKYQDIMLFSETDKKDSSVIKVKKIHASLLTHALQSNITDDKRQQIDDILKIPVQRPPLPPVTADLRPYQKDGFYWMHHLYRHNFGGCLADDMGLGKTLQTITLIQYIYSENRLTPPTLVVAPTSLLHNWKNEIMRFAPELNILIYAGTDRNSDNISRHNVVISSYGIIRNDIAELSQQLFQLIILDESQYIKNPDSLTCKTVMKLNGRHKLTLTGTPLENSLDDLWAQFNFINKGLLGSLDSFRTHYVQPIKNGKEQQINALRRIIAPFLLRRTKEEVAPDLPPLLEEIIYCDMSDAQTEYYNAEKNRIRNFILQSRENTDVQLNKIIALEALNRLRQLANHPSMIFPEYSDDSGKMEQVLLTFDSLRQNGHKTLLFSSYVKHLNLLAKRFDEQGWKYSMLTGQTQQREQVIDQFIHDPDIHAFFISLKAGATGLNLTAADYVFILDPWWNPAAEMQALSRAHRIGQSKTVIAMRFISTNTVEEKMIQLQQGKTALYNTFINTGNAIDHFTWDEFEQIIG